MSLGTYLRAIDGLVWELEEELSEADIERAFAIFSKKKAGDLYDLLPKHAEQITRYLRKAPSARKKKKWCDDDERIVLLTLALRQAKQAHVFLAAVVENYIEEGCSYRDMLAQCSAASLDTERNFVLWPFEDHPSPWS